MAPKTVIGKIQYRISSIAYTKAAKKYYGDFEDISKLYKSSLEAAYNKVLKNNPIDTLIITGGPFHWVYLASVIKSNNPKIKTVVDLRDFWTSGDRFNRLSIEQQNAENEKELYCINQANIVITPAERIKDYLCAKYSKCASKIHLLSHGYDRDELPTLNTPPSNNEIIRFVYGGILYNNMNFAITKLAECLNELKKKGYKVVLDLYTFGIEYQQIFESLGLSEVVNYHETIQPKEYFKKCLEADFLLQLRAGNAQEQHFKSTKFYELIALKKHIIYFGPDGDISDFITKNKLGFSSSMNQTELIESIIHCKKTGATPNPNISVSNFEFSELTKQLQLLIS